MRLGQQEGWLAMTSQSLVELPAGRNQRIVEWSEFNSHGDSGSAAEGFFGKPAPLYRTPGARIEREHATPRSQIIEDGVGRYEPAALSAQASHQTHKIGLEFAIRGETVSEMRVQDAGSAFFLQPVLVRLAHGSHKRWTLCPFAGRKPAVHPRTFGIVVRHPGADAQRIKTRKNKIAAVTDSIVAQVSPEIRMPFNVAEMPIRRFVTSQPEIERAANTTQPIRTPIQGLAVVVIGHRDRVVPEVLSKLIESVRGLFPGGSVWSGIVPRHLKAFDC